jgi:dTDP-4-dehydrorhamnose 3,5-epimerase
MERLSTRLDGPVLIRPRVFGDARGFFLESYRASALTDLGITDAFVQDNHSRSSRGVLRGMHFAVGEGSAKLVRCARGAILDVLVDLRRGSPTFGDWEAYKLDDENLLALYVPVGFAHGFCVLSEVADVLYKQSRYYDPAVEREVRYNDPDVGITWRDVADELPFMYAAG